MKTLLYLLCISLLPACTSTPPIRNERPPIAYPPARVLLQRCEIAVRFNEDEKSVKESEYLDGAFCMGLVEGIVGTNQSLSAPLFCLPARGIKMWEGAKTLVEFGKQHPELHDMPEPDFAVSAMIQSYPCILAKDK